MAGKKIVFKPITSNEIPYDCPSNWSWIRLNQLYNFIDYRGKTPKKIEQGIPLVTAKNVRMGYMDYSVADYISMDEYKQRQSRGISHKGDILFTTEAPLGNVAIADLEVFSGGQRLITFQKYDTSHEFDNRFFYYYMLSDWFQRQLHDKKTGNTVEGIKAERLKLFPIPFPPLQEQKRIVNRIENMFHKLDEAKEKAINVYEDSENRQSALLFKAYSGALTKMWREKNGISKESWERIELKRICKINPPKIDTKEYSDDLEVSFFPMNALSEITGTITDPQTR